MDTNPDELAVLDGARLGRFVLRIGWVKQLRQSGWKGFSLYLEDRVDRRGDPPVVKGIFSRGGKDGVKPWLDIVCRQRILFEVHEADSFQSVDLVEAHLLEELFGLLGRLIPCGGHLMVSYEEEDSIHIETMEALRNNVPPAATALGFVLFLSGFSLIKNWYLSEGGHEGPRKLWAEKAPDAATARTWTERTVEEIRRFLEAIGMQDPEPIRENARSRALRLLQDKPFAWTRTQ